MRGKRSKQYRKLMQQYALTFNFREPYQVLVDAEMIQDTNRFKMDLVPALSRTLHGEVKPMITHCSIRHIFALPTAPQKDASKSGTSADDMITRAEKTTMLDISRSLTLRRCNHHNLPEPLSTLDCYRDVLDSKDQGTNKHRYILAAQDETVRAWARGLKGVPMIYVKRSVMVMEPMAQASVGVREKEEKVKLRSGVKKTSGGGDVLGKRKRESSEDASAKENRNGEHEVAEKKKKKKTHGLKGPNPLSMKKKKSKATDPLSVDAPKGDRAQANNADTAQTSIDDPKKKRRRKHKSGAVEDGSEDKPEPILIAGNESQ